MRAQVFIAIAALVAAPSARAGVISAVCGGSAQLAAVAGVSADDADGTISAVDGSRGYGLYVIARDPHAVAEWNQALARMGFARIVYDRSDAPWCGLIHEVDGVRHAVRWPAQLAANGSVAHRFEGMPADVWSLYVAMQGVGLDGEVCAEIEPFNERRLPGRDVVGSLALRCSAVETADGHEELRILPGGDFALSRIEPAANRHCTALLGNDARALEQWHDALDEAQFDGLPQHAATLAANACIVERVGADNTHRVLVGAAEAAGERGAIVARVANEIRVVAGRRFRFDASLPGGETRRLTLLDAFAVAPIADTDVIVTSGDAIRCISAPCPSDVVEWRGRTDAAGDLLVPARFVSATTDIGTRMHEQQSVPAAATPGANVLALVPRDVPSDDPLASGLTPLKLVDSRTGRPIANARVTLAAGATRLEFRSNALGYVFFDEEMLFPPSEWPRVSVPGYRTGLLRSDTVELRPVR
jgi:hypothetical protein